MKIDKILQSILILSLLSFMINILFIIISEDLLKYVAYSVLSLYIFIGTIYINQSRNNGVNNSVTTQQTAGVVLGTILLIVIITIMFKAVEMLNFI